MNICILKDNKSLESIFAEIKTLEMGLPPWSEFSPAVCFQGRTELCLSLNAAKKNMLILVSSVGIWQIC